MSRWNRLAVVLNRVAAPILVVESPQQRREFCAVGNAKTRAALWDSHSWVVGTQVLGNRPLPRSKSLLEPVGFLAWRIWRKDEPILRDGSWLSKRPPSPTSKSRRNTTRRLREQALCGISDASASTSVYSYNLRSWATLNVPNERSQ